MGSLNPSLYIHIPFCKNICSYCDFPKLLCNSELEEKYISRLVEEIKCLPIKDFRTIYIGGGTPSCLDYRLLFELLTAIRDNLTVDSEFSFEANPESLSSEKCFLLKKMGVNRISIGVQSFNPKILALLNRNHTEKTVEKAVDNVKKAGIDNFNLDFIYGLRMETEDDLSYEINKAHSLKAKHLSFYALQIEKGTYLSNLNNIDKNPDQEADEYEFINKELERFNYHRYEVSNFCLKGFESKHNLTYWKQDEYLALGLGATSFYKDIRQVRTRNIFDYIKGKDIIVSSVKEDKEDEEFDFIMLNLRLAEGFELKEFMRRFNKDFLKAYEKELGDLKDFFILDSRVRIKPRYIYILDSILVDLLHFKAA